MVNSRPISTFFQKESSNAPLVIFRIIFGALMLFGSLRFLSKGWVYEFYIEPEFHFTYLGFSWIKPLPGLWMYVPVCLLILSSFFILIGAFYRISTIIFFFCFTYIELLDKTYYLNHYYFVSLIAFLLIFLPANQRLSYDAWKNPRLKSHVCKLWHIWIIRFQLGVVYFFAGVAKLESDWLFNAQPLKIWLQGHREIPFVGKFLAEKWVAYLFSWFGCVYDLSIPFFLASTRFRPFAYFFVVVFHIITWLLFPIGVFPWVMIFSTLIFFSVSFHESLISFIHKCIGKNEMKIVSIRPTTKQWAKYLIFLYLIIQVILPFRYLIYPGNVFWTEEGFRFSWRVMLMHKEGNATFFVKDKKTGGEIEIENCRFLTDAQIDQMATQPDFILQYAQFLKAKFQDTTLIYSEKKIQLKDPEIHALVYVSLNGRMSQKFVDKKHDLTKIPYNFAARTWLEPF